MIGYNSWLEERGQLITKIAKLEAENAEYHEHVAALSKKLRRAAEENEKLKKALEE